MSRNQKASGLTPPERRLIEEKLKEGWSVADIELLTGRSNTTIQNIKKDLGLSKQPHFATAPTYDLRTWFEAHGNWEWKNPRETKSKEQQPKRDFWAKETGSNFRTPYHYPGRVNY